MDFHFSDEQDMLRELAREILVSEVDGEFLKAVEATHAGFDAGLWAKLAEANLLGLLTPEEQGGMGFGFLEVCVLLEEVGRTLAPVPIRETLVLGALPILSFGTDAQKAEWLTAIAKGEAILTGPLLQPGEEANVRAVRSGDGWVLDGEYDLVSYVDRANRILVPALSEEGPLLFLVDPSGEGFTTIRNEMSNRQALFSIRFEAMKVAASDRLGGDDLDGTRALAAMHDFNLVATCAMQVGVSDRAIEMTAEYVREREQFGVPIGSFQAVHHRMADAYVDLEAMRWTCWRAAWKASAGQDASREAMVAKFWSADAGPRIADSCQHLHAGHGVDLDYGIHRYFLWTKSLELSLGSATPQLVRLGRDMARTGPQEAL
jgi:alkylation response protein AidB-like acyl-CoA dehydrogenase